jgi:hypothetical protein
MVEFGLEFRGNGHEETCLIVAVRYQPSTLSFEDTIQAPWNPKAKETWSDARPQAS